VEGAVTEVYLDGEGVGGHDSRQRCPDSTTTYTLRALGPGGESTADATVEVTEPSPDTQGPPAPSLVSPVGGVNLPCEPPVALYTMEWSAVSDPSGISRYRVGIQRWDGATWVDDKLLLGHDTNATTQLQCSQRYRWRVMAQDGAGNEGSWSGWEEFVLK
jgi:hypothetical protein